MTTELITFKMDSKFLKEVDKTVKESTYHNRTEMIRAALRKEVDEVNIKKAMAQIAHLKGASKRKTTDEEYERARDIAFQKVSERFR